MRLWETCLIGVVEDIAPCPYLKCLKYFKQKHSKICFVRLIKLYQIITMPLIVHNIIYPQVYCFLKDVNIESQGSSFQLSNHFWSYCGWLKVNQVQFDENHL